MDFAVAAAYEEAVNASVPDATVGGAVTVAGGVTVALGADVGFVVEVAVEFEPLSLHAARPKIIVTAAMRCIKLVNIYSGPFL